MTVIMAWIKQRWSTSLTDGDYPVRWSTTLCFKHKASRTRKLGKGADFTPRKSAATSSQPERAILYKPASYHAPGIESDHKTLLKGNITWAARFEPSSLRPASRGNINIELIYPTKKYPPELFGAFIPSREQRRFRSLPDPLSTKAH